MFRRIAVNLTMMLLLIGVGAPSALAHVPDVEEEMVRRVGTLEAGDDFSFENPFVIPGNIEESRAVFSYLHRNDVDVFQFVVTPDQIGVDPTTGAPTPIVSASALPPACRAYASAYPVTALVGPGLPPPPEDLVLPFDVPAGQGVVFAPNPRVIPLRDRPVFNFPEGDYAWFVPLGLTEECLLRAPWQCDFSNTINTPVFVPGTYSIVIWNPNGRRLDYTANFGFREDLFEGPADTNEKIEARTRAEVVTPLIENFKLNHVRCNAFSSRAH